MRDERYEMPGHERPGTIPHQPDGGTRRQGECSPGEGCDTRAQPLTIHQPGDREHEDGRADAVHGDAGHDGVGPGDMPGQRMDPRAHRVTRTTLPPRQ